MPEIKIQGIKECEVCGEPIIAIGNTKYCERHGDHRSKKRVAARKKKKLEKEAKKNVL